ncbi:MAG TPA: PP2C family serine/threonine-protein phosphatase [Streptosporangiaceae bacterium]|nr:PP2C family serine/threonine-protein phosphatase [Streptosporangiaceae bacterium]
MAMVMNAFVVSDGAAGEPPAGRDHEEIGLGLVAAVSDRGLRHERNEDAVALATVDTADGPVVISVVCDGVSSADRPDEASLAAVNAAVQTLAAAVQDGVDPAEGAEQAVAAARAAVDELADGSADTPAATYVSAVMAGDTVTLCWMGDSRAYWLDSTPDPAAQLLTRDDSLAEEMVAQGLLHESEALESPQAHVVTRWIGAGAREAYPHVAQFTPPGPGALMLCSDGLWNYDPDGGKLAVIGLPGALTEPGVAAALMVNYAVEAGGLDNITVAITPYPVGSPAEPDGD